MFKWLNKIARVSEECPQCLTPPPLANHCPHCGKALAPSVWVEMECRERRFEIDETKEGLGGLSIRISNASDKEVCGTWRLKNEVRRVFTIPLGGWVDWETSSDLEIHYPSLFREPQKPLNVMYLLGFMDFDSNAETVTLLVKHVARFKTKA